MAEAPSSPRRMSGISQRAGRHGKLPLAVKQQTPTYDLICKIVTEPEQAQ